MELQRNQGFEVTYDEWKAREDAFDVDPNRCDTCGHPEHHCDCLCCHEPPEAEQRLAVEHDEWFSPYAEIHSDCGRLAVTTCRKCGAAVLIDAEHATLKHIEWHLGAGKQ